MDRVFRVSATLYRPRLSHPRSPLQASRPPDRRRSVLDTLSHCRPVPGRAHVCFLSRAQPDGTRVLIHTVCEPTTYETPSQPLSELADAISTYLASSFSWDVYVDGSWYPLPGTADPLLGESEDHTGGCGLIFVATDAPLMSGVVLVCMDARQILHSHGGGARLMELLGVAVGILLLHRLRKCGRVFTDNQGIFKQLSDRRRMCQSGQRGGTPFALTTWDILQAGQISLTWHRGNHERREKNRALWSRDYWGLYLANLFAPPRADPSPSTIPIRITQTILTDLAAIPQQLIPVDIL